MGNNLLNEKWPWIEGSHGLRMQMLDLLSDADLAFNPGGQNMTLGALCREIGEIEHAYTQSLQTFRHDWSYRNPDAAITTSVARLKAWFQSLDDALQAAIIAFPDDAEAQSIERGGAPVSVAFQLDVYLQAMLIFLGKAAIYLRAMIKPLPPLYLEYIG
jgi:hypothetical protein